MVPDSKVHGTNMGPIWGRQDPGGPHVGPMNFAIWGTPHKYITGGLSVTYFSITKYTFKTTKLSRNFVTAKPFMKSEYVSHVAIANLAGGSGICISHSNFKRSR